MQPASEGSDGHANVDLFVIGETTLVTKTTVSYRTARAKYELIPSVIIVTGDNAKETMYRVVRCRLNRDARGPVRIASCPEHIRATLREVDPANWDIELEIASRKPDASGAREDRIELAAGDDPQSVCTLVVKAIGNTAP